jgi:hypothetical protein
LDHEFKKCSKTFIGIIFTPNVSCCRWFFHILSMLLLERAHNHLTTSWGLPSFQHWELRWSLSSCMCCFALYSNEKYISQLRWVQIEKMCSYLFYIYMLFVWCYYFLAVDRGHYTFFWKHVCNHVFHIIFHQFIVSFVFCNLSWSSLLLCSFGVWLNLGTTSRKSWKNLLWESVEILENHRYASDDRLFQATDVKKSQG